MDQIYQAVKGFLKSVVNLFVAAIGLLAGIIDGIAFIMEKIKPRASRRTQKRRKPRSTSSVQCAFLN